MTQDQIEHKFNEIFRGAREFDEWRRGYADQQNGYPPRESSVQYIEGYGKSYEEGERKCQTI